MKRSKRVFDKSKVNILPFFVLIVVIAICYVCYIQFFKVPKFSLNSDDKISTAGFSARLDSEDVSIESIEIFLIVNNDKTFLIYSKNQFDNSKSTHDLDVGFNENSEFIKYIKKAKDTELTLTYNVQYKNKFFNSELDDSYLISVDFKPPEISNIESDGYVYLGGVGYIRLQSSLDVAKLYLDNGNGDLFYPISNKKNDVIEHLIFFTCSNKPCNQNRVKIYAEDFAKNSTVVFKKIRTIKNKKWPKYLIKIDRENFTDKYNEILNSNIQTINKNDFLRINKVERALNESKIKKLTTNISLEKYFKGQFNQLANSKVSSYFSEERSYYFSDSKDEIIDIQLHWGYDLSSTRNADVFPINSGKVVYVDNSLGIYGSVVIIDHGLGFYSLYSHLNNIYVKKDEIVNKNTLIGLTGTTGMAFGDHLHLGIYLQGVPVDPVEFWDRKYINLKIDEPYEIFSSKSSKVNN